ncbi:MAG: alpha-glucosidase [Lachnospiraceae bacterium]
MKEQDWWQNKIAYQIYPKSFYDSNGDGIGDLPGIISKLDYLQDLGVDILWLSPIYQSPMADQGYDISDYYRIDPCFGTMEDMEELIEQCRIRSMYVLMDLVVNHCSDEHEWFQKAKADPTGEYANFFYMQDTASDALPTNWRSYFGGPVWEPLADTGKSYLHVFHKKQPDLNWENPKVRQAVYNNINWWLEKGLGGFRIDAIINIKKALPLRSYAPDREDGLCHINTMLSDATGIDVFLRELKQSTFEKFNAFTVGELFSTKDGELLDFIGEDGYFSSVFDFAPTLIGQSAKGWYDNRPVTPEDYKEAIFTSQARVAGNGFLSTIIENHDEPRGVSRYLPAEECNDTSKKMLAATYFFLRGIPFLYQGQEIGMENTQFHDISEVDDVSTISEYQIALQAGLAPAAALRAVAPYSRDNARTPMQWNTATHSGFTAGTPWLAVNPNYRKINVAAQQEDTASVLHFYKQLIAMRKNPQYSDTLVHGSLLPVYREIPDLIGYYRQYRSQRLLLLSNFQNRPQTLVLEHPWQHVLLSNLVTSLDTPTSITLKPYQTLLLDVSDAIEFDK